MPQAKIKFVEVWPESKTRWYLVNTDDLANVAAPPAWDDVTGKPSVFPAEPHVHDDPMKTDSDGNLLVTLSKNPVPTDAFERVRVAAPFTQFESQFQYDLQPLIWEAITAASGTVTHVPNQSSAQLSVAAGLNSAAALQTYQYHRYIPGRGFEAFMTFVLGAATAGVRKRVGYFDTNNGIFLEQNGTTDLAVVRRSYASGSPVDERVVQASWNLDKLNGTGPSGLTLDVTKAQILIVTAQWLGVGRAVVAFDINGVMVPVHQFLHANIIATVYTQTFNLPLRYEVLNTTGANTGGMLAVCCNIATSGDPDFENYNLFAARRTSVLSVGTASEVALIAIRPALTYGGLTNRTRVLLTAAEVLGGSNSVAIRLLYNASVTGGSWAAVDGSSSVEVNRAPTGFSGGVTIDTFGIGGSNQARATSQKRIDSRYPICLDSTGANPRGVVICAQGVGGSSDCLGFFTWREIR